MVHDAVVVSSGVAVDAIVDMVVSSSRAGKKILLVHGGAVEGAHLELAVHAALGSDSPPVAFVHRSGEGNELRSALHELSSVDADLEVLVTHTGGQGVSAAAEARLLDLLEQEPEKSSLRCVFGSEQALDTAIGAVLSHAALEIGGIRVLITETAGRALGLELLLENTDRADSVERLRRHPAVAYLDVALLDRLEVRHRERVARQHRTRILEEELARSRREAAAASSEVEVVTAQNLKIREADGDLVFMLRAAAAAAERPLVLEDENFCVRHWSDEPRAAPLSLAELLTPTRLRRVADGLEPGIPSLVRLGTPAAGARLLLRLGRRRHYGYLSILGCPQRWPPGLGHLLGQLEAPVVTALGYERGLLRIERTTRSQLLRNVLQGTLTGAEALQARKLIGWTGHQQRRIAFVWCGHPDERSDRLVAEIDTLLRDAERSDILAAVVGWGLAALLPDDIDATHRLQDWSTGSQNPAIGLSAVAHSPGDAPRALRQAEWAARIARGTNRRILRFEELGIDRLLFPFEGAGEPDLERPLRLLRESSEALSFDAFETVSAYLESGGNVRSAAQILHVHVNTLRYRLERIGALSGLNLDDGESRFEIQLALRVAASREVLSAWDSPAPDWSVPPPST